MNLPENAIVVDNVVKVYGEKTSTPIRAIDGLTLAVKRGEIFGLLGRNGAGKTTLLRILTTLVLPTSGNVSLLGIDVRKHPYEVRKNICAVLQENAVELYLSVMDNLSTYARFHSMPKSEIKRRAERAIEQFDLGDCRNQKLIDLSGGLKRRVQVAKVFMVDKPVVFLDEATTGMDPISKRTTLDAIREQARRGRTVFLTTHMLQEAEELCDTITIIDKGKCVASGDLQTIKSFASRAFDISITFESLNEAVLAELKTLPLLKLSHKHNTVEMCVKEADRSALDIVNRFAAQYPIVHFEVTSASLEDVFLELLGQSRAPLTRTEENA